MDLAPGECLTERTMSGASNSPTPRIASFSIDQAVLAVVTVPLERESPLAKLTPVERQVAILAATGRTNAEIGRRRGTSERTVANQMASILRKVGVGSRYHLTARLASCPLEAGEP
jgi:DNA-binding CsgD family transcriptional regulator